MTDITVAFHEWLNLRRIEWRRFVTQEGGQMTFGEYLSARSLFLKEKNNG